MGSIDRRIQDLERLLGGTPEVEEANSEERRRLIEELEARRPEIEERMAREEAEGDFTRRRALEELEEVVKRRSRARGDGF